MPKTTPEPCYCFAYDFPHRLHSGRCRGDGETRCPNCGALIASTQIDDERVGAAATYYYPKEVDVHLSYCQACEASGWF